MFEMFAHQVKPLTVVEFFADTAVCFGAVLIAATLHQSGLLSDSIAPQLFEWAAGFALVMSLTYSFLGVYRRSSSLVGMWPLVKRSLLAVLMGALIAFLALVVRGKGGAAIRVLEWAVFYVVIGALAVRGMVHLARKLSIGLRRVLIVGTGDEARGVARDITAPGKAQSALVGFYPAGVESDVDLGSQATKIFSRNLTLEQVVNEQRVDEIVVAVREQRGGNVPMDELLACRTRGIKVLDLAGFYERVHSEVPTDSLKASWLVYGQGFYQSVPRAFIKRCFDLTFSAILLTLALPVMLLAMIAIRVESPGPIFYRQERVGLAGRPLICRKFRSMRTDAEKDGVARWATKGDSRITRVGLFLRKTRIDELPQLLSVLFGDMSLVGPRPERPSFVNELRQTIPFYDVRHSVKPGVTGWAQIRYGYCATIEDSKRKHQFDLYYVKNNSLLLDLLVLIETVSVVLFREGAQ